jgi:Thiamine pyrophosphate enzyme, N-terminal TPP binding domain
MIDFADHPLLALSNDPARDTIPDAYEHAREALSMIVPAEAPTMSEALAKLLVQLGVTHAFGLFGGGIAPFCEAVSRTSIRVMHFRHEAGAAFAAIEMSIATGKPVVVFATTGPGLTNAITGMMAARWEGARVIFVSGATGPAQRGRWAFQETSALTMPSAGLFSAGPIFHHAVVLESAAELETPATAGSRATARRSSPRTRSSSGSASARATPPRRCAPWPASAAPR